MKNTKLIYWVLQHFFLVLSYCDIRFLRKDLATATNFSSKDLSFDKIKISLRYKSCIIVNCNFFKSKLKLIFFFLFE